MQEQLTPDFGDYELIDTGDFENSNASVLM